MPLSKTRTKVFRHREKYMKARTKNNVRYGGTGEMLTLPVERPSMSDSPEGLAQAAYTRLTNLIEFHDKQHSLPDIIGAWHDSHHRGYISQAQEDLHAILGQCKNLSLSESDHFEKVVDDVDDGLWRLHDRWKQAVHSTYMDRADASAPKVEQPGLRLSGHRYLVMAYQVETALRELHQAVFANRGWGMLPFSNDEADVVLRMAELHGTTLRTYV